MNQNRESAFEFFFAEIAGELNDALRNIEAVRELSRNREIGSHAKYARSHVMRASRKLSSLSVKAAGYQFRKAPTDPN